jgi:hypothetical protein
MTKDEAMTLALLLNDILASLFSLAAEIESSSGLKPLSIKQLEQLYDKAMQKREWQIED